MFEVNDRVRIMHHKEYPSHKVSEVYETNVLYVDEEGIWYRNGIRRFYAYFDDVELISKRTRKKVKPTLKEKKQRALLKKIEREMEACIPVDEYEDDTFARGWDKGQTALAKVVLDMIAESRKN